MKAALAGLCVLLLAARAAWPLGSSDSPRVDTFRYDDVARVIVENAEIYAIEVTGGGGRGLEAQVVAPAGSPVGIEHRRVGDTVTIRAYRRSRTPFLWGDGSHLITLRVPRATALELRTNTGSIRVAEVDGPKSLSTDTGRIEVVGSDGDIRARSDTGSHVFTRVAGDIDARGGTGGIELDSVEGRMDLDTGTGSIQGVAVYLTGDSSFTTDTGSVTLDLDQPLEGLSFDLRTDTGTIILGDTRERGRLVLDQGGLRVVAQTDTGSIHVRGSTGR